jgi:uncharacterized protein (TIGR02246 family)
MLNTRVFTRRWMAGLAAAGGFGLSIPAFANDQSGSEVPDVVQALLKGYDAAFSARNTQGVLATFCPDAILIGTSPGEIWSGRTEIAGAYRDLFSDFDQGMPSFQVLWNDSGANGDMAWFLSQNKVTMTQEGKKIKFGLNLSVTLAKTANQWLIRTMHFSNLADPE